MNGAEQLKLVFWCPEDSFTHKLLLKYGWREISRVAVSDYIEVKMEPPRAPSKPA